MTRKTVLLIVGASLTAPVAPVGVPRCRTIRTNSRWRSPPASTRKLPCWRRW